jgi:uncharacterized membrane protein YhaH (DUF805 family)
MLEMLFSINGRVGRMAYWMSLLGVWVGAVVIVGGMVTVGGMEKEEKALVLGAWLLAALWPLIAIQVKRWHDRDKSGVWVLINCIPILGEVWALVENGFFKGTEGTNRFDTIPIET